jgi:hypothetical protein
MNNWPFPIVNGERTPESVALMALRAGVTAPVSKPLTQYEQVMSDPETEDALL